MFATYYRLSQHEDPWVEHPTACQVSAFLRYTNAIAEWTTLGLMASERCITIYNFRNCRVPSRLFTTYKTICYCCGIWIVAILFQLATLTGNFGSFGYNELFVKCDFVQVKEGSSASITPRIVFFALESAVPCVLILIGYLVILFQVYSSSSTLSFFGSRDCQRMVAVRRSRTTRVIVKLLSVYLVCVIPVCVFNLCEGSNPGRHKDIGIFLYCIYWPQYCVNNFIYVVSNGRYRCAYYQFLCLVTCRRVSFPATPSPHCQPPHRGQIYSIHSSSTLQQPLDSRFRTPSECEEARCRVDSFFFSSFLSARNSDDSLKEAVHPNLCVSVSPDSCFSSHSASLSSTSSLQTLVKTKQRPRHLSHSVKRDLKAAGHKLRRTFSF
ncbi:uncharacterized protein LOC126995459 isoform X2 [Eriocheir sinensis]|nr:uncharacterized protein LOC126995459 isoform X2 [Eriocheir sinensis]